MKLRFLRFYMRQLRGLGLLSTLVIFFFAAALPAAAQSWTQLFPTGTPPPGHYGEGEAYDEINDRLIIYSGTFDGAPIPRPADVWVLTNATGAAGTPSWVQLSLDPGPTGSESPTVVYDPTSNRIIVYGGCFANCGYAMTDTWALTNANGLGGTPQWIPLPYAPVGRAFHSAVYDPGSNRMIMFGGNEAFFSTDQNDVWILQDANGIGNPTWVQLAVDGTPPTPRDGHAAVYDQANNRMIVFGGSNLLSQYCCSTLLNDVWILTHANGLGGTPQWIQLAPAGTLPPARLMMRAVYDPASRRMTVFGGLFFDNPSGDFIYYNDVWTLLEANGMSATPQWVQLNPTGGPIFRRRMYSSGYSPTSNRMVVTMGLGYDNSNNQLSLNDVWVLTGANGVTSPTSVSVNSSVNPSAFNQPISFSATVSSSVGTPTGTVDFTADGGISLGSSTLEETGIATISVSSLAAGLHSIKATYGGDASYTSSSASLAQTVNQANTALSLASSLSPSSFNQPVIFTATITPQFGGESTGSVGFYADGSPLGTATVGGNTASFETTGLSVGTHSVSAIYGGDSNFLSSLRSLTQKVKKTTTTTALASSQNPSFVGQPVTLTATITPAFGGTLTGTVTFTTGTTLLSTVPVGGGSVSYTTDSLPLGSTSISAAYSGDANFGSSSKSLSQKVNKYATAMALNSSLNPSVYGQAVTFTATVSSNGPTPTGTVEFRAGATVLATGTLAGGTATFTTSVFNAGSYSMKAVYSGDASSAASTSPTVSQKVTKAATTVALLSSPNPSAVGQTVTFTATVSAAPGTPDGTVTFKAGSKALGTVTLSNGSAAVTASFSTAKPQTITATYSGAANYLGNSATIAQVVH